MSIVIFYLTLSGSPPEADKLRPPGLSFSFLLRIAAKDRRRGMTKKVSARGAPYRIMGMKIFGTWLIFRYIRGFRGEYPLRFLPRNERNTRK